MRSTIGVVGVHLAVTQVLVVKGCFREEGTCGFKALQAEKV